MKDCWHWLPGADWPGLLVETLTLARKGAAAAKDPRLGRRDGAGADSINDMDLLRSGGMDRGLRRRAGPVHAGHVSCARSPSVTSANSTRSPRAC
jgi:hypothetical protein